jgi:hypothetical protein
MGERRRLHSIPAVGTFVWRSTDQANENATIGACKTVHIPPHKDGL